MQYKVDSYTLEYIEDEDKYYISFIDSVNQECKMEIEREIFYAYLASKRNYIKIKNETSRHLEQSELSDEEIYNRASEPGENIEETVMKNIEKEKMQQALKELTDTQTRRIELHIVNEITIRDIAQLEKVRKKQIEKSLQMGFKKIKKIFEK